MSDTNVDIVNINTGSVHMSNIEQSAAWSAMPEGGYDAGWRIQPHGRKLVTDGAVGGEDISAVAVERINQQVDIIRKVDPTFLPTATVRPFGTQILDNNGRQFEVRKDLLRNAPQATGNNGLATFGGQIAAEEREDFDVPIADINIGDDGLWYLGDDTSGAMPATPEGWRGLMAQVGQERSWLAGLATIDSAGPYRDVVKSTWDRFKQDVGDKRVRVGVRVLDGNLQWYRTVSKGYSDDTLQANEIIGMLDAELRRIPGGDEYRMTGSYNPNTTAISVDIMRQCDTIPGMGSGDVYQTGFRFWTGDNGNTGWGASGLLMRNLCINIMITALEEFATASGQHRKGGEGKALAKLRATLALADSIGGMFSPSYRKCIDTPVSKLFGSKPIEDVVSTLTALRAMKGVTSAISRDVATEAILLGLKREQGDTLAWLVNGVTRVHDGIIPAKHVHLFEEAAPLLMMELTS